MISAFGKTLAALSQSLAFTNAPTYPLVNPKRMTRRIPGYPPRENCNSEKSI
jgi:hypothetical protein